MWKDLIERFFYPLLERAIPSLYADADTDRPPRYLDKEFRDILNTSDPEIHSSAHAADFLIEVPLKRGASKLVLLHVEVQGQGGGNLPERMFHYMSLIYAHHRENPAALALVTGRRPAGEATQYEVDRSGTRVVYSYNRLVVAELNEQESGESGNPIDLVLAAAKHALAFPKDELQKFRYLKKLALLLSERNWNPKDTRDLANFLERVTRLTDPKLKAKWVELQQELNEEGKVMYVSLLEQHLTQKITQEVTEQVTQQVTEQVSQEAEARGELKGIQEGRQELAHDVLMKLLALNYPIGEIAEITGLPEDEIRSMTN